MMNARKTPVQDSDLRDSGLLARLLQTGVLVLDERANLRFASAGACEILGAASEAELRDAWSDIGSQLHVAEWPRQLPDRSAHHGRADVRTPAGVRTVRFEMHEASAAGHARLVVLVRDRGHLLPTDDALLLASEARANRHVLTGLVHNAKGPLNNFTLTLALLTAAIARTEASSLPSETLAHWTRYIDVLRNESARLAGCVDDIYALTSRHEPTLEAIDLCAMLRECERVLRHDATMREISLTLEVPETPVNGMGDPRLVRVALLSLMICLLDLTLAGGRIESRVTDSDATSGPTIAITTSRAALPPSLIASLYSLAGTAESEHSAAIAGRLIIEAQGGDVSLDNDDTGTAVFRIRIPAPA